MSNHRIFSCEGVKTTEEDCVRGMGRHLNISDLKITTLRNREEVQDHINDTDLVFCLVTCVILCPRARALEAGVSTPEVLNPALGANPVKKFIFWFESTRALTNRSSAWVDHQTSGP